MQAYFYQLVVTIPGHIHGLIRTDLHKQFLPVAKTLPYMYIRKESKGERERENVATVYSICADDSMRVFAEDNTIVSAFTCARTHAKPFVKQSHFRWPNALLVDAVQKLGWCATRLMK